ncbi:MAG: hypothetical protein P1U70_07330 [Saprospiraceae bacterium]|jgi:ubiquinone biosynthesis protein|nr:hypothetical protein [Saprospiraceae bacterium]
MIEKIILYWFKIQAAKSAQNILIRHYTYNDVLEITHGYWQKYLHLKSEVPTMPTIGGSVSVNLAAMSMAFYHELIARGQSEEVATQIFYDIAWKVYVKMGRFSWWLAGWDNRKNYSRLLKATQLFRAFPFNSPSYQ